RQGGPRGGGGGPPPRRLRGHGVGHGPRAGRVPFLGHGHDRPPRVPAFGEPRLDLLPGLPGPQCRRAQHDVGYQTLSDEVGGHTPRLRPTRRGELPLEVAGAGRLRFRVPQENEGGHYCPIAWTPPSTWMISPVVAGNQSESRAATARAVGSGLSTSHPSGARSGQAPSISPNPGIDLAAVVRIGPAETRLHRIPAGPRSRAR